ncbi:MAG: 4,5-dihydroxyphthalate decarboxylase [Alphaproteobacteria bacterium]|nr:4,5-dihydroxyphthalate decarboxylase [Alphaproteobacteria bacterium]
MISIALDRYDRHLPFFDGTVGLPGGLAGLQVLQVGQHGALRDGTHRHERMLRDGEFDAAETSLASYIVAKSQDLPFTAIPVFPRRLFSQGQIFVHAGSGIEKPSDLEGRVIGLQSFQTTLAVLAKGDLATEYNVSLRDIKWDMLCSGEIDALFYSRLPEVPAERRADFRRLFEDPKAVEADFLARNGYWPIMHLMVMKRDLADKLPDLPGQLMETFDEAKRQAYGFYDDSNYSLMADARLALEGERRDFGDDPWTNGLAANRKNLERFIGYSHDQRLIAAPYPAERLFHESTHAS